MSGLNLALLREEGWEIAYNFQRTCCVYITEPRTRVHVAFHLNLEKSPGHCFSIAFCFSW